MKIFSNISLRPLAITAAAGLVAFAGLVLATIAQAQETSPTPSPSPTPLPVLIRDVRPSSGPLGTEITVVGHGFTGAGNKVEYPFGRADDLTSNGTVLKFTLKNVPICDVCTLRTPPAPGSRFGFKVTNANGSSDSALFTLTGSSPTPTPTTTPTPTATPTPTPTPTPTTTTNDDDDNSDDDDDDDSSSGSSSSSSSSSSSGSVAGTTTSRTTANRCSITRADLNARDAIANRHVPLVVERIFAHVFGRKPTATESSYWKGRVRCNKPTQTKLLGAMNWHKAKGRTMPPATTRTAAVKGATSTSASSLIKQINAIFRSVYGRNPTVSENTYWQSRVKDKPSRGALAGAMQFHKANNIQH